MKTTTMSLNNLKPHSGLEKLVDTPQMTQIEACAEVWKNSPSFKPQIEVLPDGQVLCGLLDVRAAEHRGLDTVEVVIRDDLAGVDDTAVEMHVLDNLLGSNSLCLMEELRCIERAKRLARDLPAKEKRAYHCGDLVDIVTKRFGKDRRTAQRYAKILKAPREIQDAFDRGQLALWQAEAVPGLSREQQNEIVAAIRDGVAASDAVAPHVSKSSRHKGIWSAFNDLIRKLNRARADLEGREDQIRSISEKDAETLRWCVDTLNQILNTAKVPDPTQCRARLNTLIAEYCGSI